MAVELPEPLQWVLLLLAGTRWPEADEDQLREMADHWRKAAQSLQDAAHSADAAVKRALDGQQGAAAEALTKHWAQYTTGKGTKDDPGLFPGLIDGCNGMGDMLEAMANSAETAKIQIVAQLGILAFDIATAEAEAPVTFGASMAQIPIVVGITREVVGQILKKLLTEALEHAVKQAVQMAAINLMAQTIEVMQGHRKSIDMKELGQNALGGAVAGATGHVLGKGVGAAGEKLGMGQAMGSLPGKMATGAAVGVGTDVITQGITTGHVDTNSLLGSGLSGAGGVGAHAAGSAVKDHFKVPDTANVPHGGQLPTFSGTPHADSPSNSYRGPGSSDHSAPSSAPADRPSLTPFTPHDPSTAGPGRGGSEPFATPHLDSTPPSHSAAPSESFAPRPAASEPHPATPAPTPSNTFTPHPATSEPHVSTPAPEHTPTPSFTPHPATPETHIPTPAPDHTPTPSNTFTPHPATSEPHVSTPAPEHTPTPSFTPHPATPETHIPTPAPDHTPTPSNTFTPHPATSETHVPTPTPDHTPTPSNTPHPATPETHIPTPAPDHTPTPSNTFTPHPATSETHVPTPTPDHTPTPSNTFTPHPATSEPHVSTPAPEHTPTPSFTPHPATSETHVPTPAPDHESNPRPASTEPHLAAPTPAPDHTAAPRPEQHEPQPATPKPDHMATPVTDPGTTHPVTTEPSVVTPHSDVPSAGATPHADVPSPASAATPHQSGVPAAPPAPSAPSMPAFRPEPTAPAAPRNEAPSRPAPTPGDIHLDNTAVPTESVPPQASPAEHVPTDAPASSPTAAPGSIPVPPPFPTGGGGHSAGGGAHPAPPTTSSSPHSSATPPAPRTTTPTTGGTGLGRSGPRPGRSEGVFDKRRAERQAELDQLRADGGGHRVSDTANALGHDQRQTSRPPQDEFFDRRRAERQAELDQLRADGGGHRVSDTANALGHDQRQTATPPHDEIFDRRRAEREAELEQLRRQGNDLINDEVRALGRQGGALSHMSESDRLHAIDGMSLADRRKLATNAMAVDQLRANLTPKEFARTAAHLLVHVPQEVHAPISARNEAHAQVERMLQDPDVAARLLKNGANIGVAPKDKPQTTLPGLEQYAGRTTHTGAGGGRNYDDIRGSGGKNTSFTEENLTGDHTTVGGSSHYAEGYSTTTHEFAHTIHDFALSDADKKLIKDTYDKKFNDPSAIWVDGTHQDNYSRSDDHEYFAQVTNAWLGTNHGKDTKAGPNDPGRNNGPDWVRQHEPDLVPLLERLYGADPKAIHSEPANQVRANTGQYEDFREFWAGVDERMPESPAPAGHAAPTHQPAAGPHSPVDDPFSDAHAIEDPFSDAHAIEDPHPAAPQGSHVPPAPPMPHEGPGAVHDLPRPAPFSDGDVVMDDASQHTPSPAPQLENRRPLPVAVRLGVDGPQQHGQVTPDKVWVTKLDLSTDRPMTRFGEKQESHTVPWGLTTRAVAGMSRRPVSELWPDLKHEITEMQQFKPTGAGVSASTHQKVLNRWNDITARLNQIPDTPPPGQSVHEWHKQVGDLVSGYVELSQLTSFATYKVGRAVGHGEASIFSELEKGPVSADRVSELFDGRNNSSLTPENRVEAKLHMLRTLQRAYPEHYSVDALGQESAPLRELRQKLDIPAAVGVSPAHAQLPQGIHQPHQVEIGSSFFTDLSIEPGNPPRIGRVMVSNTRPDTKFGSAQMSHTSSWSLMRAAAHSFEGKPVGELHSWLTERFNDVPPNALTADPFVNHWVTAARTELGGLENTPQHEWPERFSNLMKVYVAVHQKLPHATFADELQGGQATGSGELDLPYLNGRSDIAATPEQLASHFDGAAPFSSHVSADELQASYHDWRGLAGAVGPVNEDAVVALADRTFHHKTLGVLNAGAARNPVQEQHAANYFEGVLKWEHALRAEFGPEVGGRAVSQAWQEGREAFSPERFGMAFLPDRGGNQHLHDLVETVRTSGSPSEARAAIEELVRYFRNPQARR
ncbi:WXG100-like domain-containing protein [Kitasatospora sp. NPDC001175]